MFSGPPGCAVWTALVPSVALGQQTSRKEEQRDAQTKTRRWLWILLLTAASVFVTLGMACATPFAALATLAALHMSRRDGLALIGIAWLADQAVGYGLLGYPRTANSFAWGVIRAWRRSWHCLRPRRAPGACVLAARCLRAGWPSRARIVA